MALVRAPAAAADVAPAWTAAAITAIAVPTLIAYNLPPSATFFNQAAALFGWGLLLAMVASVQPVRVPLGGSGPAALLAALALIGASVLASPPLNGLPWGLALQALGLIVAAALTVLVGAGAARVGAGAAAFRAFCIGLVVAGVATTLVGIVQVYLPQWADGTWIASSGLPGRAIGNVRQPNHVASLLMWSLIAVVWLGQVGALGRTAAALLGVLLLFGVVQTGSRTGWLGVGMMLVWGALDRRLAPRSRALLVLSPVVLAVMWFGVTEWAHYTERVFGGESQLHKVDVSSSRFGIWANTAALIARHPWAGVGWGEFNFAWSMSVFPNRPVALFDHTHNLLLQFAVELGLPLALLVLALIGWALWRVWSDALGAPWTAALGRAVVAGLLLVPVLLVVFADRLGAWLAAPALALIAWAWWRVRADARGGGEGESDAAASMPRAAFAMVLMILVHSLLEYPLWYSYFLLPAAFAFGLALGGVPVAPPPAREPGRTRPLLVASMLVSCGAMAAVLDYMTVVAIFAPPSNPAPLAQRIAAGQRSVLFSYHGDYAAVTTAEHPSQAMPAFAGAVQNLLDARLMTAWATAFAEAGDPDRASYVAQRLKEFRKPEAEEFFAPCEPPAVAGEARPFQCRVPVAPLTWRDLAAPRR